MPRALLPPPGAFLLALLLAVASLAWPRPLHAAERLGVVLLHGKNAQPERYLLDLSRVLRNVGFQVLLPELPWSRRRGFDATFQQALVEIGLAVEELRQAGCTQVALAGHGLGANAAIAYAARRGGVFALVALAPSHDPERHREVYLPDVRKARSLLLTSGGQARSLFLDTHQNKDYDLSTTAEVYLSFNDPEGDAVMPRNLASLKAPLPLLWVVGLRDPLSHLGRYYAYTKAPAHPASSYEELGADHHGVPGEAALRVAEWLRALAHPAAP